MLNADVGSADWRQTSRVESEPCLARRPYGVPLFGAAVVDEEVPIPADDSESPPSPPSVSLEPLVVLVMDDRA